MARLELYVEWNIYDDNGGILETGDRVEVSYNGVIIEGVITELFCMFEEEVGYIQVEPYGDIRLEVRTMFDEILDIESLDYIEKLSY